MLSVSMETFAADDAHGGEVAHHGGVDGSKLPIWSIIPFAGILLSIAIFPLVLDSHFLVHHGGKMSLAWSLIFAIPYLAVFRGDAFLRHPAYLPNRLYTHHHLVVGIVHGRRWDSCAWDVAWDTDSEHILIVNRYCYCFLGRYNRCIDAAHPPANSSERVPAEQGTSGYLLHLSG